MEQVPANVTKNLPATFLEEMGSDAGQGFQNVTAADIAIPYYAILQALSPQVKRGPTQISGAQEGDIFNTVTQEIIKSEVGAIFIPCAFKKMWVEWKPRDSGGGLVKQYNTEEEAPKLVGVDKNGRPITADGNHLVDTAYHYVMRVYDDGHYERAIISMSSTQMKKSRRWLAVGMNIMIPVGDKKINPPMYSHTYHLTSVHEEKDSYSWFGWDIRNPQILESRELYAIAKKFSRDVVAGLVKAAAPPEQVVGGDPVAPTDTKHGEF